MPVPGPVDEVCSAPVKNGWGAATIREHQYRYQYEARWGRVEERCRIV